MGNEEEPRKPTLCFDLKPSKYIKNLFALLLRGLVTILGQRKRVDLSRVPLGSNRVLVTEIRQIGDMIFALPFLRTLAASFPHLRISIMACPANLPILENEIYLKESFLTDQKGVLHPLRAITLSKKLRSSKFEMAFNLEHDARATFLCLVCGIRLRIGLGPQVSKLRNASKPRFTFLLNGFVNRADHTEHRVDELLRLLKDLGATKIERSILIDPPATHKREAELLFAQEGFTDQDKILVMNPWARVPSNRWGMKSYLSIITYFRAKGVKSVFVVDSTSLNHIAPALQMESVPVPVLVDQPLLTLVAFLKKCSVYLGPDSGILHLAAVAGLPCVGLYGSTDPSYTGPLSPGSVVIKSTTCCPVEECDRERCQESRCMDGISSEQVQRAIDDALFCNEHVRPTQNS